AMNSKWGGACTSDSALPKRSTASLKRPSLKACAPSVAKLRAPARCSSVCAKAVLAEATSAAPSKAEARNERVLGKVPLMPTLYTNTLDFWRDRCQGASARVCDVALLAEARFRPSVSHARSSEILAQPRARSYGDVGKRKYL